MEFLLGKAVGMTISDSDGWTPLNAAASGGHIEGPAPETGKKITSRGFQVRCGSVFLAADERKAILP